MKTRYCDECQHFAGTLNATCNKGHKPRFYLPKSTLDTTYGFKRKCEDYELNQPLENGKKEI